MYLITTIRVFIRNIAGGDSSRGLGSIARCIIFGVPRLPIRPCDERPPAMYGHFCLVPRVSVHDRYYCILYSPLFCSLGKINDCVENRTNGKQNWSSTDVSPMAMQQYSHA